MRVVAAATVVLAGAVLSRAHEGEAHVTRQTAALAWNWDPLVLTVLALAAVLYGAGYVRLHRRQRVPSVAVWQALCYWAGWITLFLALVSPMHKIGSALFSVHMTQHELLMLIGAPLLVIGRPLLVYLWALPDQWREPVARRFRARPVVSAWSIVSAPQVVWILHAATLWIWHAPALYEAAVNSEGVHILQHSMFLVTAALFWWTLVHGRYGRMGYGVAVLYVFTTSLHSGLLGALLTLGDRVWFRVHEGRTAAWNLTPLEDQQLAGLIMWVPAGVVLIIVALAMFAAWLGESERRAGYSRWITSQSAAKLK